MKKEKKYKRRLCKCYIRLIKKFILTKKPRIIRCDNSLTLSIIYYYIIIQVSLFALRAPGRESAGFRVRCTRPSLTCGRRTGQYFLTLLYVRCARPAFEEDGAARGIPCFTDGRKYCASKSCERYFLSP